MDISDKPLRSEALNICIKRRDMIKKISQECAGAAGEQIIPSYTVSSLGLKFALILKHQFAQLHDEQTGHSVDEMSRESFADAVVKLMSQEFDYTLLAKVVSDDHIRLKAVRCPFKAGGSYSVCTIMHSIIGGLALANYDYCKIAYSPAVKDMDRPCVIDIFLDPAGDVDKKPGIEFPEEVAAMMREHDESSLSEHRQARRKLVLNMFTNLAISLREYSSEEHLAEMFLENLKDVPGIDAAALYLAVGGVDSFNLVGQHGFSKRTLPMIKKVDSSIYDDDQVLKWIRIDEEADKTRRGSSNKEVHFTTTLKLRSKDNVNGLLVIGCESATTVSLEVDEALQAACTLLGTAIDGARLYSDLEKAHIDSIAIINKLVSVVDRFGRGHSTRVAQIAEAIAGELGLHQDQQNLIYEAGIVHDLGRICVPPEILNKPGKLTDEEFALVKEHPRVGADLISPLNVYKKLVPAVLYHHERLDGSGYPDGLKDGEIPVFARIIAVADIYDAMTCDRAYRSALSSEQALTALQEGSGIKYDRDVVDALVRVVGKHKKVASWI